MATQPAPYASASLYIGDLAPDVTEALLFEIFNAVGPVASVRVCRDAATRRSLGYAYVNFHRVEDAERALDTMNFKNIRNQPCRIMWSHRDPSLRKSGVGNIFVKNLAKSIDNKQLYDTFSMFGNILSCKVATNMKGEALGYGFVHYETEQAATSAIQRVDGKVIAGQKVVVNSFKPKADRTNSKIPAFTNVYCKNVPLDWPEDKIADIFSGFGQITSTMIAKDGEGKSKGFAFINFAEADAAAAAIEKMNVMETGDPAKPLIVCRAQSKEERAKELRERFEQLKVERQKKFAGVNLYVKNLADEVTDDKLMEAFARFGGITSAKVMREADGGPTKGFGFVCFSNPEDAQKAMAELNGKMLEQKPLYVAMAQRKDVRRAQLEAQQQARQKMMPMQQQMFPQGAPTPMFYPTGAPVPQRNFVYPQQMMARQWAGPQQAGPMMRHPGMNYQLMPIQQRVPSGPSQRGPGGGGRGGGRGGMRGGPPKQANARSQNRAATSQQPEPALVDDLGAQPLTIKALAAAPEEQQKQMIGEKLFPLIKAIRPELAGKITGMLLEMDNGELLHLLESRVALEQKVAEAITVLEQAGSLE